MNTSTSEYSSGCESGWTMYLDQNSNSTDPYSKGFYTQYQGKGAYANENENVEDDEDLSMVSDASSGPPHSHHYENNSSHYYGYPSAAEDDNNNNNNNKKKKKSKSKTRKEPNHHNLCLDDTASSSIFHFSQDNVPHSDDHNSAGHLYSAAHFEDESRTKKGLSFFKSSTKGKSSGEKFAGKKEAVRNGKIEHNFCVYFRCKIAQEVKGDGI
ncbi:hypothetical protein C2S53_017800 [Perilla frutescens var. hirtella]|uniref:Uncharacterized protein n=1 Tax=Perilla frutescens var. hirtella TaxID=608512 RepID=A0AAD4J2Z8_PERFH|nr:hypothetical protein C2S53_017800 [Perilla frutescens var. hirtella]